MCVQYPCNAESSFAVHVQFLVPKYLVVTATLTKKEKKKACMPSMGIAASVILMVLSIQESCRTVVKVKCMFFILFSLRRCKMYFIASTYIAH